MKIQNAIELFKQHQKTNVKKITINGYMRILDKFQSPFAEHQVHSVLPDYFVMGVG